MFKNFLANIFFAIPVCRQLCCDRRTKIYVANRYLMYNFLGIPEKSCKSVEDCCTSPSPTNPHPQVPRILNRGTWGCGFVGLGDVQQSVLHKTQISDGSSETGNHHFSRSYKIFDSRFLNLIKNYTENWVEKILYTTHTPHTRPFLISKAKIQ